MWSNIEAIANLRLLIEVIYFLCGPLLVVAGFFVIQQIKLAKDINRNNSLRESYKLSAEQCGIFAEKIMPLMKQFEEIIEKEKIEYFTKSVVKIDGYKVSIQSCKEMPEYKRMEIYLPLLEDILNKMESFALYFDTRIANEKTAYLTLGEIYCGFIERYFALIFPLCRNSSKALLGLFFLWRQRKASMEMDRKREELQKEIKDLELRKQDVDENSKGFNPIGCD